MSTLFAVSAYFELTGMTLVFIGAAIGIAGAFVALRAGLEEKVGGTLMLCVVIAQIVLCTGLI
jgi:hypothetical protein